MILPSEEQKLENPKYLHEMLVKRYKSAKGVADEWTSILEACFHYAVPFRNKFYQPSKDIQGEMKNSRVYDTTAVESTKVFVSKLQDTMTPPQTQWGFYDVDTEAAKQGDWSDSDIETAQIEANLYMRKLFNYIHKSNFDVTVNECYYDLAIGTASLVINQNTDDDPVLCTSIPIDKLAIEEAVNGKIESWFRTWQDLKISELNTRWKKVQLTAQMLQDMASDPDAKVRQLYEGCAYFPRNKKKKYLYSVWTAESCLFYEWLESKPGIVWRYQKTNNETWGRGPVMDALPTIITLNELSYVELASANLNVFKPYMAWSDSVFNPYTFKLEPFTVIPIAPLGSGGSPPLIPLQSSSDPNFAQVTIADLRMQIKALLFADNATDSQGVQPETAYELSIKQQNLAQKIGPLFSRSQHEMLEPVVDRFSYILHNMGILPRPKFNGIPIKFRYKSPLQLAKGQDDIAKFTQFVQLMQGIMGPEMTAIYINPRTTPYGLAQALQINDEWLNKPDDVAAVMQRQQDLQAANSQAMTPEQPQNPSQQTVANI